MSSIIQGYEYDIFISYRHNDNRSGWVTEFVTALQEELAATIKEPVSVYFDTNPHDGLLETHNVDKSLEGKLKCLIFIPIISQTYCDTKSFAWTQEFCVFNKQAKEDTIGIDIKFSNGNVASRILPVKIHELDQEDKYLLENEMGSFVRSVDFIYREAGVNRPLKKADIKNDNQNKTDYRNQVNKVANAIKEIIQGIRKPFSQIKFPTLPSINYPKTEKTIAVLPFVNMSNDPDQEYFSDGIAEELINVFSQLKELKVIGRTSSFSFKNKNVDLKTIGNLLNVENILEGSIQKAGNRVRITAQLINASDGYHIWSQRYDREMNDIFALQDDICSKIAEHLKLTLLVDYETKVERKPTHNMEAYELFLKGNFYHEKYTSEGVKKSIEYFEKVVELDPGYGDAWWSLGLANFDMQLMRSLPAKERVKTAKYCAQKAIAIEKSSANAHFLLALIYINDEWNWEKAGIEIALGEKYNVTQSLLFQPLEAWYRGMIYGDFDFATHHLQRGVEIDPLSITLLLHWAMVHLLGLRDYEKTRIILNRILELDAGYSKALGLMCNSYLSEGKYDYAEKYAQKYYDSLEEKGHGTATLIMCLAASGKKAEAKQLYQTSKETLTGSQFSASLHVKVNAYLGQLGDAFNYLDIALAEKEDWLFTLKFSSEWDLLRPDPRLAKVLKRMNFPD